MRRLSSLLLLSFLLAGRALGAPAVLVTANYPPYSYDESGEVKGLGVELIREAFRRMHHDLEIVVVPFPRALEMVKAGEADGIFPFAIREDRKALVEYSSESLLADPAALVVRAGSTITFDGDLSKLSGYTIGRQRGADYGPAFQRAVAAYHLNVEDAIDQENNMRRLLAGRFDMIVGPHLVLLDVARRLHRSDDIRVLYSGLSVGDVYVGFAKTPRARSLMAPFDQALRTMRLDGAKARILGAMDAAP